MMNSCLSINAHSILKRVNQIKSIIIIVPEKTNVGIMMYGKAQRTPILSFVCRMIHANVPKLLRDAFIIV